MKLLDSYLPSLDAATITTLQKLSSQFTEFTKSFASMVVHFTRAEVLNWVESGKSTYLYTVCAAPVLPSVYAANRDGLAAMTPGMAASLRSGLIPTFGDEPALSPLISPFRAVIYWSWLVQRLFWVANHDGLASCDQNGPINHRGFIASSDILSAMAPDWTGLYRPLPQDFPGVLGGSFPTTTQNISGSQSAQNVVQAASIGTPEAGLSSAMILIVVLIIILIAR